MQEKPNERSFDTVSAIYKLHRDLLEAEFGIFKNVKADDETLNTSKTASEIYKSLHQADVIQMLPELHKIMKIFAVIPATTWQNVHAVVCGE